MTGNKPTASFAAILDWNNHVLKVMGVTYDVAQLDMMALHALHKGDHETYKKLSELVTCYPR